MKDREDREEEQLLNKKGGRSVGSKVTTGISVTAAAAYGAYRLGKRLTAGKPGKKRAWRDKIGRGHEKNS
jgi:hypothetical protein